MEKNKNLTTVVVVPLVALKQDLMERCSRDGKLECVMWTSQTPVERLLGAASPSLVFVSAENAADARFIGYLSRLRDLGRLSRIVFDEAHLLVTSTSYRPKLKAVAALRVLDVPFVALTATLPPHMEAQLNEALWTRFCVVRAQTARPNIKYQVEVDSGNTETSLVEKVVSVAQKYHEKYHRANPGSRGIIYTPTKAAVDQVYDALARGGVGITCIPYHGDLTLEEKKESFHRWKRGDATVMVATSGFGAGIDYDEVGIRM
jgi:superfamily II DNA helicase RecQ